MRNVILGLAATILLVAGGVYFLSLRDGSIQEKQESVPREAQQNIPQYGLDTTSPVRMYNPEVDLGGNEFSLEFLIPEGWEVEYDNQARILNLFTLEGGGFARERSQILITYFDASQFLTLSTVTIHEVLDLQVGQGNYTAKRYDIEKRLGVTAFVGQPSWRNERHIAIDFRDKEGYTRYYSIAKNPQLDEESFQRVLASIKIVH